MPSNHNSFQQIENTEDPLLYHGQPKLKHVVLIVEAMYAVPSKAKNVTLPYLVVTGQNDVITPLGPMEIFHNAVPQNVDKSFRVSFIKLFC